MADEIDLAQQREQIDRELALAVVGGDVPAGEPGECEWCGRDLPRLIGGACGRCRDEHRLP